MRYYVNGAKPDDVCNIRRWLVAQGHSVVSTVDFPSDGFNKIERMKICYSMISLCDGVYFARDWEKTEVGKAEYQYAKSLGKQIHFESKQWGMNKCQRD